MSSQTFNKVAKITILFWIMKIIATTLGETLGDFIAQTLGLGYTIGIAITLAFLQPYWLYSSKLKDMCRSFSGWLLLRPLHWVQRSLILWIAAWDWDTLGEVLCSLCSSS